MSVRTALILILSGCAIPPAEPQRNTVSPEAVAPKPDNDKPSPSLAETDDPTPSAATSSPKLITPAQAGRLHKLIEQADSAFAEAIQYFNRDDPSRNPDWYKENHQALELFDKARGLYGQAMDISGDPAIRERQREAENKWALCSKRSHVK